MYPAKEPLIKPVAIQILECSKLVGWSERSLGKQQNLNLSTSFDIVTSPVWFRSQFAREVTGFLDSIPAGHLNWPRLSAGITFQTLVVIGPSQDRKQTGHEGTRLFEQGSHGGESNHSRSRCYLRGRVSVRSHNPTVWVRIIGT